ncbi:MAG: hypothetical protein R3C49_17095 [Planctomycetaceae bacterium]
MSESDEPTGLEHQLQQMREKAGDLMTECRFQSCRRMYAEVARLAKGGQQAMHYIYARFHEMVQSHSVLDFARLKECAVELIAVIEDEDRARAIQADLPQAYYEYTQQWMTACLYENLADGTGMTDGFNSTGMHQCISDGIQVCRRTGKLQCVACFREYATDVYTAADDLLMARHQCETILAREGGWSDRGDRRWYASIKLSNIHLLEGRLREARETALKSLDLINVEGVTLKMEARVRVLTDLDTIAILTGGERADWSLVHPEGINSDPLTPGEWPGQDLRTAMNEALALCCHQKAAEAVQLLIPWDRRLLHEAKSLHLWFELRLRLIAAMLLSGDPVKAGRLGDQLKEKATSSNDFLTLRRLQRLLDDSIPVNPLAPLAGFDTGPFADPSVVKELSATASADTAVSGGDSDTVVTEPPSELTDAENQSAEFHQQLMAMLQDFFTSEDPEEKAAVVDRYLRIGPASVPNFEDCGPLLHLASILGPNSDRDADFWHWGKSFEQHYPNEPSVISMVAVLGEAFRNSPESPLAEQITDDEILKRHRLALSMDANRVGNHLRAGSYFMSRGDEGEAERCLARAFRLDRSCVPAATQLAELYQKTDRLRDAMEVLDICLREGAQDPNLAMEATTLSLLVGQFQATLSYAEKVREYAAEDVPWVDYYKAVALVELNRPDDALEAIDAERRHEHSSDLHLQLLTLSALLVADRADDALAVLRDINGRRISEATELTFNALCRLFGMAWSRLNSSSIPANHAERRRFDRLLLVSGLTPDEFFEGFRIPPDDRQVALTETPAESAVTESTEPSAESSEDNTGPEVQCFRCLIRQPLDSTWPESQGCLAGQEDWTSYIAMWTVLAENEDQAADLTRDWQSRCERLPGEVLTVTLLSGPYNDHAGIVVQGIRWCPSETEDRESEDTV